MIISFYEKKLEGLDLSALFNEAAFCGSLMERAALVARPLRPSEFEWCRAVFQSLIDRSDSDSQMKLLCETALRVLPYLA